MRRTTLVLPAILLLLSGTACDVFQSGGSDDGGAAGTAGDDTGLEFVECMREQGVDMPDPEENGRPQAGGPPEGVDPEDPTVQAALEECDHLMMGGGEGPQPPDEEGMESLREFVECMREQGLDMPDPEPDGTLSPPEGMDPEDPEFQEPAQDCQNLLDGQGVRIGGGSGEGGAGAGRE